MGAHDAATVRHYTWIQDHAMMAYNMLRSWTGWRATFVTAVSSAMGSCKKSLGHFCAAWGSKAKPLNLFRKLAEAIFFFFFCRRWSYCRCMQHSFTAIFRSVCAVEARDFFFFFDRQFRNRSFHAGICLNFCVVEAGEFFMISSSRVKKPSCRPAFGENCTKALLVSIFCLLYMWCQFT